VSEIGGNLSPKLGEVAPDFDFRFGGIEATALGHTVPGPIGLTGLMEERGDVIDPPRKPLVISHYFCTIARHKLTKYLCPLHRPIIRIL